MDKIYSMYLFKQFKQAKGIHAEIEDIAPYAKTFDQWIREKEKAAIKYVDLFEYMKNPGEEFGLIAEFDKGGRDTIAYTLAKRCYEITAISRYAHTFKDDSVKACSGYLCYDDNYNYFIQYQTEEQMRFLPNCSDQFNNNIQTIVTQLPLNDSCFSPFIELSKKNNILFIGTYGLASDKDAFTNAYRIYTLSEELKKHCDREISYEKDNIDGTYVAALKMSLKKR